MIIHRIIELVSAQSVKYDDEREPQDGGLFTAQPHYQPYPTWQPAHVTIISIKLAHTLLK